MSERTGGLIYANGSTIYHLVLKWDNVKAITACGRVMRFHRNGKAASSGAPENFMEWEADGYRACKVCEHASGRKIQ